MRQVNLKIVKAAELVNEIKSSVLCEIIFKDAKYKTKPVKNKLFWDNIFELGDYRSADNIYVRLGSRRSTVFGGCVIPLKDYKKCGIFEKEINIYEYKEENGDDLANLNTKDPIGILYVEVIIFSPISLARTQSEKKVGLNIFNRLRSKDKVGSDSNTPPLDKQHRKVRNGAQSGSALNLLHNSLTSSNKSGSHSNLTDDDDSIEEENNNNAKNGHPSRDDTQITFGEFAAEKIDSKTRERKRKRKKKQKSEEEETPSISSNPPPSPDKKKERKSASKSLSNENKSSKKDEPVIVIERERKVRKNEKLLRRSVSLAHNEKSFTSVSAPAIQRAKKERSSRKERSAGSTPPLPDENLNNNNHRNHNPLRDDSGLSTSMKDSTNTDVTSSGGADEVTVVRLQPLADDDSNQHKLFGVSLDDVMNRQKSAHPDLDVPHFFVVAAQIIRHNHTNGGNLKGIFRIRGKITEVKELRKKIDCGEEFEDFASKNVHTISTLMKAFLRELPVPLLTFENYDKYIQCADEDISKQKLILKDIVDSIPFYHYTLLKFVMKLMYELSLCPDETQMTAENLARVISPNLIWKEVVSIDDMSQVDDALKGNQLANTLIVHYQEIFTK